MVESHVHTQDSTSSSGMGFLLGVIVLLIALFALIYYGLPLLQNASTTPSIQVPSTVDVNLNQK